MAVIWQRKKNLVIALIIGGLIVLVPLGTILSFETINYLKCKEELSQISKDKNSRRKIEVYTINSDKSKGDLILENDLTKNEIYCNSDLVNWITKDNLVGKELKIDIAKGTVIDKNMLYEEDKVSDDIRIHIFSDIELNSEILEGCVVDIRIVFPDGEDYIIAQHKKIFKRIEDSILINVNEEEILKLASARVDKNIYEGAKIYAIMYVKDYQEPGKPDYPVNASIIELGSWNPNLIKKVFNDETISKRNVLEANMNKFVS